MRTSVDYSVAFVLEKLCLFIMIYEHAPCLLLYFGCISVAALQHHYRPDIYTTVFFSGFVWTHIFCDNAVFKDISLFPTL